MLCYSLNKQKIRKGIPVKGKFPVVGGNAPATLMIADVQIYKMAEAKILDPWIYSLYELVPRSKSTVKDKILLSLPASAAIPDISMGDTSILLDVCCDSGLTLLLCSKGSTCLKLSQSGGLLVFNGNQPQILKLERSTMNPDLVGLTGVQMLSISDMLKAGSSADTSDQMDLNRVSIANT
jgi:hypothetical protein